MISGKSQGSGTYSYHERYNGRISVYVSHMPEDGFSFRIAFKHLGETTLPVLKLDTEEGLLLWSALKAMATATGFEPATTIMAPH